MDAFYTNLSTTTPEFRIFLFISACLSCCSFSFLGVLYCSDTFCFAPFERGLSNEKKKDKKSERNNHVRGLQTMASYTRHQRDVVYGDAKQLCAKQWKLKGGPAVHISACPSHHDFQVISGLEIAPSPSGDALDGPLAPLSCSQSPPPMFC